MIEKEWLERVSWAYKVYSETLGNSKEIEDFISWLYRQYGIIETKRD